MHIHIYKHIFIERFGTYKVNFTRDNCRARKTRKYNNCQNGTNDKTCQSLPSHNFNNFMNHFRGPRACII